eukprot:6058518-Prymnesium_polylepis.2
MVCGGAAATYSGSGRVPGGCLRSSLPRVLRDLWMQEYAQVSCVCANAVVAAVSHLRVAYRCCCCAFAMSAVGAPGIVRGGVFGFGVPLVPCDSK